MRTVVLAVREHYAWVALLLESLELILKTKDLHPDPDVDIWRLPQDWFLLTLPEWGVTKAFPPPQRSMPKSSADLPWFPDHLYWLARDQSKTSQESQRTTIKITENVRATYDALVKSADRILVTSAWLEQHPAWQYLSLDCDITTAYRVLTKDSPTKEDLAKALLTPKLYTIPKEKFSAKRFNAEIAYVAKTNISLNTRDRLIAAGYGLAKNFSLGFIDVGVLSAIDFIEKSNRGKHVDMRWEVLRAATIDSSDASDSSKNAHDSTSHFMGFSLCPHLSSSVTYAEAAELSTRAGHEGRIIEVQTETIEVPPSPPIGISDVYEQLLTKQKNRDENANGEDESSRLFERCLKWLEYCYARGVITQPWKPGKTYSEESLHDEEYIRATINSFSDIFWRFLKVSKISVNKMVDENIENIKQRNKTNKEKHSAARRYSGPYAITPLPANLEDPHHIYSFFLSLFRRSWMRWVLGPGLVIKTTYICQVGAQRFHFVGQKIDQRHAGWLLTCPPPPDFSILQVNDCVSFIGHDIRENITSLPHANLRLLLDLLCFYETIPGLPGTDACIPGAMLCSPRSLLSSLAHLTELRCVATDLGVFRLTPLGIAIVSTFSEKMHPYWMMNLKALLLRAGTPEQQRFARSEFHTMIQESLDIRETTSVPMASHGWRHKDMKKEEWKKNKPAQKGGREIQIETERNPLNSRN